MSQSLGRFVRRRIPTLRLQSSLLIHLGSANFLYAEQEAHKLNQLYIALYHKTGQSVV